MMNVAKRTILENTITKNMKRLLIIPALVFVAGWLLLGWVLHLNPNEQLDTSTQPDTPPQLDTIVQLDTTVGQVGIYGDPPQEVIPTITEYRFRSGWALKVMIDGHEYLVFGSVRAHSPTVIHNMACPCMNTYNAEK